MFYRKNLNGQVIGYSVVIDRDKARVLIDDKPAGFLCRNTGGGPFVTDFIGGSPFTGVNALHEARELLGLWVGTKWVGFSECEPSSEEIAEYRISHLEARLANLETRLANLRIVSS